MEKQQKKTLNELLRDINEDHNERIKDLLDKPFLYDSENDYCDNGYIL